MPSYHLNVAINPQSKKLKLVLLAILGLVVVLLALFYQRSVNFSYSGQNCFRDFTVLPKIFSSSGDGVYGVASFQTISVKNYPLISAKTCIYALESPVENTGRQLNMSLLSVPMPNKKFNIIAEDYPKPATDHLGEKISIRDPLIFPLDKEDKIFKYWLTQANSSTLCKKIVEEVVCDVGQLKLKQNTAYNLKLERYFKNQASGTATEIYVKTVEPVAVIASSVANGGTIYDKPTQISITTNKSLVSAKAKFYLLKADGKKIELPVEQVIDKQQINFKLKDQLPRNAGFELVLTDAVAEDKGILFEPYKLAFKTSGGPKVLGVNIGNNGVEPGKTITISFDQHLAPAQTIGDLVSANTANGNIAVKTEINGNKLIIKNATNLPICAKFSIKLHTEVINQYGVGGDSAWSTNSRIRCYTTTTIGYSVQGRAITAWRFGSGAKKYVYFGTTHGNERSTKYLMDRWIAELDANFDRVPPDTTIIVIPNLNPDGFNANSRRNANNVDLNRNFPANDWKKDVTMPGGELVINGAGTSPLSEPESQAIANFVIANSPRLILTYHSVASIVSGNSVGLSDAAAVNYSNLSGYSYSAFGEEDTIFNYDTTGAFETWTHDKIGIPTILVELGSSINSEFNQNRSAMWNTLNY